LSQKKIRRFADVLDDVDVPALRRVRTSKEGNPNPAGLVRTERLAKVAYLLVE
jgi:hypothetical protein